MSETVLNDSIPVERKWKDLLKYNIFLMKLVEFGLSLIIMIMPLIMPRPFGRVYCIATAPTLVMSFMFICLYLMNNVPAFLEKMYLFFQILFTFGAFIECILFNMIRVWVWLIFGILYFGLLSALVYDFYLIANERGCTFNVA